MNSLLDLRSDSFCRRFLFFGFLVMMLAAPRATASSGIVYIQNNTRQMIYVWINGSYQGGVPGGKMAYTVVEGFVTPESGFDENGELKTEHSHGGWSPAGTLSFLARGPLQQDGTFFYSEGSFSDGGSSMTIWVGGGNQPSRLQEEFAIKIIKTSPSGNYRDALKKGSAPDDKVAAGGSSAGGTLPSMKGGVAEGPATGESFKNSIGMEMVWVAPLKLWVGKYEVTQAEYQAIAGSNPSNFQGARRPVEQVSWNDAGAFINRLNQREQGKLPKGFAYRLPFDAEYDVYVGNASLNDAVTSQGRGRSSTSPVGTLKANNFGLHDTRGNVWEWMSDWYSQTIHQKNSSPYKSSSSIGQRHKVLRGGSWGVSLPEYLAVAFRYFGVPEFRDIYDGFRVLLGPVSR